MHTMHFFCNNVANSRCINSLFCYVFNNIIYLIMPPPSLTGEVYCFSRRQLIFSYGRRVLYHSKGL